MKYLSLFLFVVAPLSAQFIVNDPVNTAVNSAVQAGQAANHVELMRQWAEQLERLNRQLQQLEAQLAVQRRIRDVMGDPSAAGALVAVRELGGVELARSLGETMSAARRLANAVESLRRTSDGIYQRLDDRTVMRRDFTRAPDLYRRYAAVDRQADNLAEAQQQTGERTAVLQADVALTLEQLRTANTQAETDKLQSKLIVLNGQLAHVEAQRRIEVEKLTAQQIQNENQAAKERQDLLERQLAEERQTLGIVGAWQEAVKVTPTSYRRP